MANIIDEGGNDTGVEEVFVFGARPGMESPSFYDFGALDALRREQGGDGFSVATAGTGTTPAGLDQTYNNAAAAAVAAEEALGALDPDTTDPAYLLEYLNTLAAYNAALDAAKVAAIAANKIGLPDGLQRDTDLSFLEKLSTVPFMGRVADTIAGVTDFLGGADKNVVLSPGGITGTASYGSGRGGVGATTTPVTIGSSGGTTYGASTGLPTLDDLINGALGRTTGPETVGNVISTAAKAAVDAATLPGTGDILGDVANTVDVNTLAETPCPAGQVRDSATGKCVPIPPEDSDPKTTVTVSLNDQILKWLKDHPGATDAEIREAMGDRVTVADLATATNKSIAEVQRRYNCADSVYAAEHPIECFGPVAGPFKVDGPATDAPTVDGPTVIPPKIDGPKVVPPTVVTPKIDGPKVVPPTVFIPKIDGPKVVPPTVIPPPPPPPAPKNCSDPVYALLHPAECARASTPTLPVGEESYQQVTTTPGDLTDIKYLYDVGGESIFAPNMSDDDPISYLSPYASRITSPYTSYASGGKVSEHDIVAEALRLLRGN